jgi:hypothetical protein
LFAPLTFMQTKPLRPRKLLPQRIYDGLGNVSAFRWRAKLSPAWSDAPLGKVLFNRTEKSPGMALKVPWWRARQRGRHTLNLCRISERGGH